MDDLLLQYGADLNWIIDKKLCYSFSNTCIYTSFKRADLVTIIINECLSFPVTGSFRNFLSFVQVILNLLFNCSTFAQTCSNCFVLKFVIIFKLLFLAIKDKTDYMSPSSFPCIKFLSIKLYTRLTKLSISRLKAHIVCESPLNNLYICGQSSILFRGRLRLFSL